MSEGNIIRIKKPGVSTHNIAFQIMLFLIWTRYTLIGFVLQVIKSLPYIGGIGDSLFPIAIIVLAILAWPRMQMRIRYGHLLFYLAAVGIVLFNMIVYPRNATIIEENIGRMLIQALPMLFVGASYEHEADNKVLFWASVLGFFVVLFYRLINLLSGRDMTEYDMDGAYKILPSITYLMYYAFTNKKPRYWIIAVVGLFTIFAYGTRGPVLCAIVYIAVCVLMTMKNTKSIVVKSCLVVMIVVALFYALSGDAMLKIVKVMAEQFSQWGVSTRIFDAFLKGQIAEGSGREVLYAKTIDAINEKPFFGNGLLGDQMILGGGAPGYYAHNLFLELWCQFGLLVGSSLILYFVGRPLVAAYQLRKDKGQQLFLLMLICINFTKLMISGTYTVETMFFFMLGVCMSATRKKTPSANIALDTRSAEE